VLKFFVAAALASGFFVNFPFSVRIGIGVSMLVFFVVSWVLYPSRGLN
jgi:hypothetical protein